MSIEEVKHKLHAKGQWPTRAELQEEANKSGMTYNQLMESLERGLGLFVKTKTTEDKCKN